MGAAQRLKSAALTGPSPLFPSGGVLSRCGPALRARPLDLSRAATDRVEAPEGESGDWWRLRGRCITSSCLRPVGSAGCVIRKGIGRSSAVAGLKTIRYAWIESFDARDASAHERDLLRPGARSGGRRTRSRG